jgi:hypothetical protein
VVGWGASGLFFIERKQSCSVRNYIVEYFSFHAETNMPSAHLKVSGSHSKSSEVEGKLSKVK